MYTLILSLICIFISYYFGLKHNRETIFSLGRRLIKEKKEYEIIILDKQKHIEELKESFQVSQDNLSTIQTAFMEYKKEKGDYNEEEFKVYL